MYIIYRRWNIALCKLQFALILWWWWQSIYISLQKGPFDRIHKKVVLLTTLAILYFRDHKTFYPSFHVKGKLLILWKSFHHIKNQNGSESYSFCTINISKAVRTRNSTYSVPHTKSSLSSRSWSRVVVGICCMLSKKLQLVQLR